MDKPYLNNQVFQPFLDKNQNNQIWIDEICFDLNNQKNQWNQLNQIYKLKINLLKTEINFNLKDKIDEDLKELIDLADFNFESFMIKENPLRQLIIKGKEGDLKLITREIFKLSNEKDFNFDELIILNPVIKSITSKTFRN